MRLAQTISEAIRKTAMKQGVKPYVPKTFKEMSRGEKANWAKTVSKFEIECAEFGLSIPNLQDSERTLLQRRIEVYKNNYMSPCQIYQTQQRELEIRHTELTSYLDQVKKFEEESRNSKSYIRASTAA